MSKNDGGPAFPVPEPGMGRADWFSGASIRDYFAAKAMQSYLTWPDAEEAPEEAHAEAAYRMADAMLAERAKEQS
jgi:hypothetical protein